MKTVLVCTQYKLLGLALVRAFESLNCYHLLNLDVASDVISVVKRTHIDFIFLDSDHEDIIEIISSLSDIKDTYVMLYAHSDISYFSRLRKNASLEKAKEAWLHVDIY